MPWPFSESIKKRACRYLLHRYLGNFLQEKLSLDQLSLDLYQGTGSLAQVPLDKWSLNELLETADAPFEVIAGFIQTISLTVPWAALLQENCALEVKGLEMVLRPRPRLASGTEPMYWSSFMTSSMQLAKECLSQKLTDDMGESFQPFEGLEKFAETIETVLRRVKVTFVDTVLRVEHIPDNSKTGIALEIRIEKIVYCDETGEETSSVNVHQPTTFAHKNLQMEGITVFWDEFSDVSRAGCRSSPTSTLDVVGHIDTLIILLSPRQVHLLLDLCGAFSGGGAPEWAKDRKSRPIQQEDEYRLHMELNRCLKKDTAALGTDPDLFESQGTRTVSSRAYPSKPHGDESRPELVFRLTLSSLAVSVLHIDPLPPPDAAPSPLGPVAARFFSLVGPGQLAPDAFLRSRTVFNQACPHDHLRFVGQGLKIDYEHSQGSSLRTFSTDVSLHQMEFLECLFPSEAGAGGSQRGIQYTELLTFDTTASADAPLTSCLHLLYKQAERRGPQGGQVRLSTIPRKAEIQVELGPVRSELDISIVDRLNSLLQPQKLATTELMASHMYTSYNKHVSLHKAFTEVFLDDSHTPSNCHVSLTVNAPLLGLAVRFPIPDLRSDQERGPWFKKSLQKEVLSLELEDLEVKTEFMGGSCPNQTKMELTFRELIGKFQEEPDQAAARFLRVSHTMDGDMTTSESVKFDWPRVVLKMNPTAVHSILERVTAEDDEGAEDHSLEEEEEEGAAHSLKDVCDFGKPEPSPFSSRRVMYENEEMVIPGDVAEMTEFQEKTTNNSRFILELCFPNVQLVLPGKAFYEKLHNSQLINTYSKDSFSQFRSTGPEEDSGSEEDTMHYYSPAADLGNRCRKKRKPKVQSKTSQSLFSVIVGVNHGLVALQTNAKKEDKTVLKNKHGEFWLEVKNAVLFSVTQHEGYKDQHYICFHTTNICIPVYLPLRSLLLVETFSISSSVSVDHSSSTFRIILDEAALFLSDKSNAVSVNLVRDYVQVVDMGTLELRITAVKPGVDGKLSEPRFELRCSSDAIHIRTCSDSCAALMNLIQYVASYGDLLPTADPGVKHSSAAQRPKAEFPSRPASQTLLLAETEQQMLQDLMSEAMEETDGQHAPGPKQNGAHEERSQDQEAPRSDLFLFPDESGNCNQDPSPTYPMLHSPLITPVPSLAQETDDFCILETPGSRGEGLDQEPHVKQLTSEPVEIKDDYFSQPLEGNDSSRGAVNFPVPEVRYLIKEISVIWHLYGGKDFGGAAFTASPARSRGSTPHSSPSQTPVRQAKASGRAGGGRGRNPDVRFQHEVYPQGQAAAGPATEQPISRQVFVVQDLEIRDRLATSQMNKFLYLYSSKEMPRKAHSNMLTVKALHMCPESGRAPQECCLRVSLMPLRLNIDQGTFAGIIIGLTQLNCSELKLRRLCYRQGLLGVDKLFSYAINEWLSDIKKNQLPGLLGGVGPIHSLVQLGEYDTRSELIDGYRKDGRIVRGFQRGTASFGTSTAMAALELTNRMVRTIQAAAETAYDMVSPVPDDRDSKRVKRFSHYGLAHQPVDLREGVAKAYTVVKEGITDTALTIYDTATREHEQRGMTGAVGGVLRQLPPAVVKPLIMATEATSNVLGGMRNQIHPDARQEESQKWRQGEE
ncbi:Autophagy-related protein 2 B [Liparis tanakae]|uniref:Autophagy-related protein 2 B n=1 Tax=Liparis tanakae TaxID=230148 RepID=A0A4Z2GU91_9TELE|nr:Autophagy-related protein 2 B [Liparis tanakae]